MTRPHPPGPPVTATPGPLEPPPVVVSVVVSVADLITAAVLGCPSVAGVHGGRFGEVATYLPGRRVPGVRLSATEVAVHLVGLYPATVAEIDAQVRAAVAPHLAGLPLAITIEDYTTPAAAAVAAAELTELSAPVPPTPAATTPVVPGPVVPGPVVRVDPLKEIL